MKKIFSLFLSLLLTTTIAFGADNSFDRLNPVGTMISYPSDICPQGYLLMDGGAISRATYSKLFGVINTKFGSGDGSTTFNKPNTVINTFTPTGTWTVNTTYAGKWWRNGKFMNIDYAVLTSGAPNATQLQLAMPAGFTIDSSYIPSFALGIRVGYGYATDSGNFVYPIDVSISSTTLFSTFPPDQAATYLRNVSGITNAVPFSFGAGDGVALTVQNIPIVGWENNVKGNCIKY